MPPSQPGNPSKSDSEFGELTREYVLQFPEKARQLRHAFQRGDWKELHRVAHRIAGSGTLYGFPELSEKAGRSATSFRMMIDTGSKMTLNTEFARKSPNSRHCLFAFMLHLTLLIREM